ncbi:MAG: hypothetical protein ACOC0D_06375 [Spirochaeta sp.]
MITVNRARTAMSFSLMLLTLPLLAYTVENRLEATFWAELTPVPMPGPVPLPGESAASEDSLQIESLSLPAQHVLEEARWVYSGIIYGWRFRYVPENKARGYDEEFETEAVHELDWGDTGLTIRQTWENDGRFFAKIDYALNRDQTARREAWGSGSTLMGQGRGSSPYLGGHGERKNAVLDALRMAVREYLRARHHTPPREVTGRIVLVDPPLIGISSGAYTSTVRVRFQIDSFRKYDVF